MRAASAALLLALSISSVLPQLGGGIGAAGRGAGPESSLPLRLLFYYGYPSLINGASGDLEAAARAFSRYDLVVLGEGLEDPSHPEHGAAEGMIGRSNATFFGYVDLTEPTSAACAEAAAWRAMGVEGVFLDRAGFDFLAPRFGGPEGARRHQEEVIGCARRLGLRVALNSWDPRDVLSPAGSEPPLDLGPGDAVLVEDAVYGDGELRPEYVEHVDDYSAWKGPGGPAFWCLVTTAASTPHENRLIGYDALTYAWPLCDAVAVQEDLGEDSSVLYAFADPGTGTGREGWDSPRGMTVAIYWSEELGDRGWVDAVLDAAEGMCLDSVALAIYWVMDDLHSSSVHPARYLTPPDGDVRAFIREAHSRGLKVVLKPSLYVETDQWVARAQPSDIDSWFESYSQFILRYASLAQEEGVEYLVVETELSSLVPDPRWAEIVRGIRGVYDGFLGYAQPQGEKFNPSEALPSFAEDVDFIGVDAYYPVDDPRGPAAAWDEIHASRILPLRLLFGKPVVFTEIGYRNVEGADSAPWDFELEAPRDDALQADLWRAFLDVEEPRVDGFLYWAETREEWLDPDDTGYSLLGKPAASVLRRELCGVRGLGSVDYLAPLTAVVGSEVDLKAAYAAPKMVGNVEVASEGWRLPGDPVLILGGPEANPAARSINPSMGAVVELSGSSGILGVGNATLGVEVRFGSLDYALLAAGEVNGTPVFLAEGLTRYGTEAASACLSSPSCRPESAWAIVMWRDSDGDGSVSPSEVRVALSPARIGNRIGKRIDDKF